MKILFKQNNDKKTCLDNLEIKDLYFKNIVYKNDLHSISKYEHRHTEYEIHMILQGYQTYKIGTEEYKVEEDFFLLIPPEKKHKSVSYSENLIKYSITFNAENNRLPQNMVFGHLPNGIRESIAEIEEEKKNCSEFSTVISENEIFKILIKILKTGGYESKKIENNINEEDLRVKIAKQFIYDNIRQNLTLTQVSEYCYLSTKQMTRIFEKSEGMTITRFIMHTKFEEIKKVLEESELTLREISEDFGFNNEYYFNTFFKNMATISPGEYRKKFKMK